MQDVNLYHLLKFYAKNWIWIVSLTIIGLIAGFIYSNFIQVPMYKSEATLLFVRSESSSDGVTQDATLINNYIELFKSRRVLEPAISKQKLNMSYAELENSIEAVSIKNTEVINVAVSTNDAKASKLLLESAVVSFKEQVTQLYKKDNVRIVDSASLASEPYNIQKGISIALAATIGFMVALILQFFVYDVELSKRKKEKEKPQIEPKKVNDNPPIINNDIKEIDPVIETNPPVSPITETENTTKTQNIYENTRKARERLFQYSYSRERFPKR